MTINFYLNKDNRKKTKLRRVFCYLRDKGKTLTLKTDVELQERDWDVVKQRAKKTCSDVISINIYLDKFRNELLEKIRALPIDYTFAELTNNIHKERENSIIGAFQQFYEARSKEVVKSTAQKFTLVINQFIDFLESQRKSKNLTEITLLNFDLFKNYLFERGYNNNTVTKKIRYLKTFSIWLYERKLLLDDNFRRVKNKEYDVETIALNYDEVLILENYIPETYLSGVVRDIFLFCIYTGARFIDARNLRLADFTSNYWNLRVEKTDDLLQIPLTEKAQRILERYNYQFPKVSNQRANVIIKEICQKLGIDEIIVKNAYIGNEKRTKDYYKFELITMHTARRTFITLSLEKGMRPETVMSISGHHDWKSFRKYIRLTSKIKLVEIEKAWSAVSD